MDRIKTSKKAHEMGRDHGHNLGSWVIDGNTSVEECQRILDGYAEGDPVVMEMCPYPLSGEFADNPTGFDILHALYVQPNEHHFDEYLTHYEDGFAEGWWETVIKACSHQVGEPEKLAGTTEFKHWLERAVEQLEAMADE